MSASTENTFFTPQADVIKNLTKKSSRIQVAPTAHFSM
jgi:hypothetical protein